MEDINTLVTRLRNTGLQSLLDIPLIAVIGNQSAGKLSFALIFVADMNCTGKSSLVEAICGVCSTCRSPSEKGGT